MKSLVLLAALLFFIPIAVTAQTYESPIPQEFWGNVTYTDGTPVPNGSIITAANQAGYEIGRFVMNREGRYGGGAYKYDARLIVRGSMGDRIYFYVGLEPAVNGFVFFSSADITYHDIIIQKPKPTPTPTPVTPTPTPVTPTPTPVTPTPSPTPTPKPTPVPLLTFTGLGPADLETIILGVFLALIVGGIAIFGLFWWVFRKHGLGEETDEERYRNF